MYQCTYVGVGEFSDALRAHIVTQNHYYPLHEWIVDSLDINLLYQGESYVLGQGIEIDLADPMEMERISLDTKTSDLKKYLTAAAFMIEQGFLAGIGHASTNYQELLVADDEQAQRYRDAYLTKHPPHEREYQDTFFAA
jgi:hypothetical protein